MSPQWKVQGGFFHDPAIRAAAAGITPEALAAALGRRVPPGVRIAPSTLVAWLAEAWSDLATGARP